MRLPVILQSDRAECGLACLAMIASYYGHRSTLRELRSRFRLSMRGTTLGTLRECAEKMGLRCRAVRAELEELVQLRTPAILHWDLDHFVVLKSVNRRGLRLVDPAVGARRLTLEEAGPRFTGVALEVAPTPAFEKKEAVDSVRLSSFLAALKGLGGPLATVFAMTLVLQVFVLVMPLNMQFTVDRGVRGGRNEYRRRSGGGVRLHRPDLRPYRLLSLVAGAIRRQHGGVSHGRRLGASPAAPSRCLVQRPAHRGCAVPLRFHRADPILPDERCLRHVGGHGHGGGCTDGAAAVFVANDLGTVPVPGAGRRTQLGNLFAAEAPDPRIHRCGGAGKHEFHRERAAAQGNQAARGGNGP